MKQDVSQFAWCEAFAIDHALMDQQHRRLLHLCAEAKRCLDYHDEEACERFHDLLHELSIYAHQHMCEEESLLREHHYPGLAAHEAEHEAFRGQLADILFSAVQGQLDKAEVVRFLSVWWTDHILGADMACKSYLNDDLDHCHPCRMATEL